MNDLYLLRNKQTGKYYRQSPTIGGIRATCDVDLNIKTLQSLFMFETPEQAFQFLRNQGMPLPKDTEVVPFRIIAGSPVRVLDIPAHVSVAVPTDAQMVLADPKATSGEIKTAHASAVVTPDPNHGCTCDLGSIDPNCTAHGC
jgi:hypothetical protein